MASEKRRVNRVIALPSAPGVAATTEGGVSAEAVIGSNANKAPTASQPRMRNPPGTARECLRTQPPSSDEPFFFSDELSSVTAAPRGASKPLSKQVTMVPRRRRSRRLNDEGL